MFHIICQRRLIVNSVLPFYFVSLIYVIMTCALDLVDELLARDLARSHVIHTAKDTLETAAAEFLGVSLDLALAEELLSQRPPHLAELKVLRLGRDGVAGESEGLTNNGVAQRALVYDVLAGGLGREKVGDDTTLARDGVGADVRRAALGDTVESVLEVVLGVLTDLGRALGVLVVEGGVSTQRLDKVPVVRRADSDDLKTRQLGVLNGEGTSGGRSTIDEDGEGLLSRLGGKRKL